MKVGGLIGDYLEADVTVSKAVVPQRLYGMLHRLAGRFVVMEDISRHQYEVDLMLRRCHEHLSPVEG